MVFNGQTKEKWGLCFAGGGGKGAYEIGVWKALSSTFNAVLCNVMDLLDKIPLKPELLKYILEEGLFSIEGLRNIINESKIVDNLCNSDMKCFASVCNVQESKSAVEYVT